MCISDCYLAGLAVENTVSCHSWLNSYLQSVWSCFSCNTSMQFLCLILKGSACNIGELRHLSLLCADNSVLLPVSNETNFRQFSSRWYVCAQKKPVCTPPHLWEVSPMLPLKQFQCFIWLTMALSCHIKEDCRVPLSTRWSMAWLCTCR